MERENLRLKSKDFVPFAGVLNYTDRYVTGIKKVEKIRKIPIYLLEGTSKIMVLTLYNVSVIGVAIKGLQKLL